jgi:CBS domain-containing protein
MNDQGTDNPGTRVLAQSMYSPLGSVIRREPISCTPDTPLRAALTTMREKRIGSMVVADRESHSPIGIFTLHDLLDRVAVGNCDLDQPIEQVMTTPLVTLDPQVSAYQAMVTMVRHGMRHVVIADEGRLAGVVSANDLFNLQRLGVTDISGAIQAASDLAGLQAIAADIRSLSGSMLTKGVGAEPLTQLISSLNDLLTMRIIELVRARHDLPAAQLCWLALGSEGRYEQTISTDQDNGLVFDAPGIPPAEMRAVLLPFAREVNESLDACGFPLCNGNVMASNPEWCRSVQEWQRRFEDWITAPKPVALLTAGIFFDFRPIWGEASLADRLRQWLVGATRTNSLFHFHLAQAVLSTRSPLGILGGFVYDSAEFPHTIDLKMHGTQPFVGSARVYALASGVTHTNTVQRLRIAGEMVGLSATSIAAAVEAFHFLQLMRFRRQQAPHVQGGNINRVDPRRLNELERHTLKEALRQGRKLRQRLELDYPLR